MPSGGQRTIGRHVVISLCAACTGCIGPLTVAPANSPTFASALPARGASLRMCAESSITEPLPRRCLHGVHHIDKMSDFDFFTLPRRCLHGVHPFLFSGVVPANFLCLGAACTGCIAEAINYCAVLLLCLGAACTGCIAQTPISNCRHSSLPRRCLHGVHQYQARRIALTDHFASALPARGASEQVQEFGKKLLLCLGAACTGCIAGSRRALRPGYLCLGAACTGCIGVFMSRPSLV